jgi:hypothetical protein
MAQAVRAIQYPDKNISRVDQMARAAIFVGGVGVFDERNRMIAWIETTCEKQSAQVSDLLLEIINNPRRAKQPDWSFLTDDAADVSQTAVVQARAGLRMPTRQSGTGNTDASTKSNSAAAT